MCPNYILFFKNVFVSFIRRHVKLQNWYIVSSQWCSLLLPYQSVEKCSKSETKWRLRHHLYLRNKILMRLKAMRQSLSYNWVVQCRELHDYGQSENLTGRFEIVKLVVFFNSWAASLFFLSLTRHMAYADKRGTLYAAFHPPKRKQNNTFYLTN